MKRLFLGLVALLVLSLLVTHAQTPGAQPEFCITSPSQTANYNKVCMGVSATGGYVGLTNYGSATGALAGGNFSLKSPPCNAVGDGVADDTAAIIACEAARPVGSTMIWPPGTYKISAPIIQTKAGAWDWQKITINSVGGNMLLRGSNFTLNGGKSTFNFDPGGLGSNGRAVRINDTGTFTTNGTINPCPGVGCTGEYSVTGNIAVGATSFTAGRAQDAAILSPGDWIAVILAGDANGVPQSEIKQVLSVTSSTTITPTTPFAQAFVAGSISGGCVTTCWPIGWYKMLNPISNVEVTGLNIVATNASLVTIGLDMQPITINSYVHDNTFSIPNGIAIIEYIAFNPVVENNQIMLEEVRHTELSQVQGGRLSRNIWWGQGNSSGPTVNSGTYGLLIEGNQLYGRTGAAVITLQDVAAVIATNNNLACSAGAIAFAILGGYNNSITNNTMISCDEGIIVQGDLTLFLNGIWIANDNFIGGNIIRNATTGVQTSAHAVNTVIGLLDTNSTVTNPLVDGGTGTNYLYTTSGGHTWNISGDTLTWPSGSNIQSNAANMVFVNNGTGNLIFEALGVSGCIYFFLPGPTQSADANCSNAGKWTFVTATVSPGSIHTAAAPTVAAAQIGYGSTTVAAGASTGGGTCPTGTVGGAAVAGCIIVNIAGTARGVPFF